ncbi:MAG: outer membrane beta-barrel protein [bacterium]|nr:outer membrane beta-barrel protein [bacterium]
MVGLIARAALCLALALVRPALAQDAPTEAPAAGTGTVSGTIIDRSSGEPLIEAGVEVLGTKAKLVTDLDGKFSVKLPAGTYQLRVYAPLYQGVRLENIHVKPGATTRADAALAPAAAAGTEVVEVVAQAAKAAEATQLIKRQKAATVQDNISAEMIKKSPDSDASEVVQRAPAVTVKDNKFIVVRGLGERYSTAQLNGSRLPSTDPQKRVVPLDLFPAEFLDALSIVKSYTPDLPGDFSGGLVEIDLREFPEELEFNLGFGTGVNTSTTFKRFRTYEGGKLDYLGFGRSFRDIPNTIGDQLLPAGLGLGEQKLYGGSFRNIWDVDSMTAPPNAGMNFSVGNSWGPFGFELAGTYGTEYKTRRRVIDRLFVNAAAPDATPEIRLEDDFVYDSSTFETTLGGIMTSAYKLNDNNKFTLRTLINRNSYDNVLEGSGESTQFGPTVTVLNTRLRYTEEELDYGQLGGEHRLAPWLEMNWRTALARTTQYIPDSRSYSYAQQLGLPPTYLNDPTSGLRLFSELAEYMTDTQVDFRIPFTTGLPRTDVWSGLPASFKFGPAYTYRDRTYALRRFLFRAGAPENLTLPPEQLFDPDEIGRGLVFSELTEARDSFGATQEIIGGYGMFDLPIVRDQLRLIAGVRVEYSLIRLNTASDINGQPTVITKKNLDPLPGINLVYSPRFDMNVRAGYSQTVARPEFRELSPVLFPEPRGLRQFQGNPGLVQTNITNYELRWEWFFTPTELLSAGFFYKQLEQPIEATAITVGSGVVDSFANVDSANLWGFEFESRKDFGFLTSWLQPLSLTVNVAYINSTVTQATGEFEVQTAANRALQGQSPFVVNAALDYSPSWMTARLFYNTAGNRILNVGAFGLPDLVELRRDQLDAVFVFPLNDIVGAPINAKFGIENILNDRYEIVQGSALQSRWLNGTKFSLGVSYSY